MLQNSLFTGTKRCQLCHVAGSLPSERYCGNCRKTVLSEISASGYLQKTIISRRRPRTAEMRENAWETKYGVD